ncbi:hypothetical protein BDB00DRAFT_403022 [Zychaea mexicana]|uniref:uncharacterized protein n=1 Tax=Zychaea mexicana TaxID=64656 RepID=UPI0022FE8A74|nr:uncharacterized protein BDB00DRAFT_403022 [Zychaea mexicana]KAI9498779.1 hypothetical protein BDB00DRAFT_403022 [Zychaea mexicana]
MDAINMSLQSLNLGTSKTARSQQRQQQPSPPFCYSEQLPPYHFLYHYPPPYFAPPLPPPAAAPTATTTMTAIGAAAPSPPSIVPVEDQDDDLEIILTDDSSSLSCASASNHSDSCSSSSYSDDTNTNDDSVNNLQRQLEYYFSRHNLANDIYLVSQMDPDLYVPITTIANFNRVQQYTTDLDAVAQALKQSPYVIVDETETKVKPNISTSAERTTVILRELPEDTSEKEISDLLRDLESPPVKSVRHDFGNMWYIVFESEKDALKLLCDIRGRMFKGNQIAARMKSVPAIHNVLETITRRQQHDHHHHQPYSRYQQHQHQPHSSLLSGSSVSTVEEQLRMDETKVSIKKSSRKDNRNGCQQGKNGSIRQRRRGGRNHKRKRNQGKNKDASATDNDNSRNFPPLAAVPYNAQEEKVNTATTTTTANTTSTSTAATAARIRRSTSLSSKQKQSAPSVLTYAAIAKGHQQQQR